MENFYRTNEGCFARMLFHGFGTTYREISDPAGIDKPACIDEFQLLEDFKKVPYKLFASIIAFMHKYEKENIEVQVILLRNKDDDSLWRAIVPRQIVTGASVEAKTDICYDLISGEKTAFSSDDWFYSGTMHLHPGKLGAFWSSTDDASELTSPGLHCTIGHLTKDILEICCSITINGNRYVYSPEQVISDVVTIQQNTSRTYAYTLLTPTKGEYNTNCCENVKRYVYKRPKAQNYYKDFNYGAGAWDDIPSWWTNPKSATLTTEPITTKEALNVLAECIYQCKTEAEVDALFVKVQDLFL